MRYYFALFLGLNICFAIGCKEKSPTAPVPQGEVVGAIQLFDSDGKLLSSASGVMVSVSGSDKTTQTDDSGKWAISGLEEGEHTFTFTKSGFGAMKIIDLAIGTTTIADTIEMAEPPQEIINFQKFSITISPADSLPTYNAIGTLPRPFLDNRAIVFCIGTDSAALAMDPESAMTQLAFSTPGSGYDGSFMWSSTNSLSLQRDSIGHGKRFFACLCVAGKGPDGDDFSHYYDPSLQKEVYTSLGRRSQILNAVMP
ncbi:MAG: carboxypeptidase-like regulatory domain-containing protein [Bacteroidota bacterium]|nr:carboxypeptidase-like regulatory domain-containing protein [Bacteroidota bacterium]MDP4229869.1 carboxypeptidase-like regulatory domain-containing protein [Bacteroidota bacterium]MDP4235994.1 carboxypeptidase-like regulatory domain-containing protein [Bacteroidota bacterium]